MALKDLLAYADDKLSEIFDRVGYDATKDRERFAKRIDDTKAKFLQTEPPRGKKDFTVSNGVVRYEPALKGNPILIGDRKVLHIPSERFGEFLDTLKATVESKELDPAIEAAATGSTPPQATERKPRAPRSDAGQGRNGWSEERRRKFAETVAARKASKAT